LTPRTFVALPYGNVGEMAVTAAVLMMTTWKKRRKRAERSSDNIDMYKEKKTGWRMYRMGIGRKKKGGRERKGLKSRRKEGKRIDS
jgi:hypothetical protein